MKLRSIVAGLLALATIPSIAATDNTLTDFPAGASPREVGTRIVNKFLATPHTRFGNPRAEKAPNYITYPDACAWLGGLWFAKAINDSGMTDALVKRFEPLFDSEKHLLPKMNHVDHNVVGSVPLEIYMQRGGDRYRDLGMQYADTQWEVPETAKPEQKANADKGYSWQTRVWIDDMFMITTIQSQAYKTTGDRKYIDRAAREMVMYLDSIQCPNGLFYHSPEAPFFWARGNGWMAAGMAELLSALPQDNPNRPRIMEAYRTMMGTLKQHQGEDGLWHQLIDDKEAWAETSGTAMFTYAMIVGVKNGWLDAAEYAPVARKGWLGLVNRINSDDEITDVCEGTNIKNDRNHYMNRKRITGDLHAHAPLLWCATELISLNDEPAPRLVELSANIRSDRRPIPVGYYEPSTDKTFVCWMSADSHPAIKAYDHATGTWSPTKIVAKSPFVDKHNYPALLRGKDGRLYMFYGCHNSTLKMAVSPEPGSIEGEWTDKFIDEAERASYPAPVLTDDGTWYVFYRDTRKNNGHADDRPYQMVKSTDNGRTWTRQMVVDPYPRTTDNMTEVYNGQVTYQPGKKPGEGRIHLAWTVCGEKVGRHAHATYGRNVYYAYLDLKNDHLYNIHGRDLGKTIDNKEADKYCQVIETPIPERGHQAGLQISVNYRDNGSPVVHYSFPRGGAGQISTWTGSEWHHTPVETFSEPRGIEKLGPDSFRFYSTMKPGVVTYVTDDGGMTVTREKTIPTPKPMSRCYVIENARPDLKLIMFTEPADRRRESLHEASRDMYSLNDIFND